MISDDDLFMDVLVSDDDIQSRSPRPANTAPVDDSFDDPAVDRPAGFHQLVADHKELTEQMKAVDELAKQLKIAVDLRSRMEDCYSTRAERSTFPLQIRIQVHSLSCGSALYIADIVNKSSDDYHDWNLTFTWSSLGKSDIPCLSETISLGSLFSGQTQSHKLMISNENISLPLVCAVDFIRLFDISGQFKTFRVNLDYHLVSLLNRLSIKHDVPTKKAKGASAGSFGVSLPCSLVNLLLGCPDTDEPSNILRLVLSPSNNAKSIDSSCTDIDSILCIDQITSHSVTFSSSKESRSLILTVSVRDSEIRSQLRHAIQLYIVILCSNVLRKPHGSLECWPSFQNVEQLFDSIVAVYK